MCKKPADWCYLFTILGSMVQQMQLGFSFFLKNVHPRMKAAALALFGLPESLYARPNTFGELMRAIISPSSKVQEAVDWALKGANPDIVLHTRMMANRYGTLFVDACVN